MNFFSNMFNSLFKMFGLFKKDAKIIFVGLDDAGKTSLMSVLKYGTIRIFDPTIHAHVEEIEIGNMKVHSVDLGGHKTVRKVWRDYFPKIDAIIYLIDAAKPSRFEESKVEFHLIMNTPDIGDIPVLILGNKVDKNGAVGEMELVKAMGLTEQTPYGEKTLDHLNGKPLKICMCSVAKKVGYAEGLEWLESQIP